MKKICLDCGKELSEDSKFCNNCGSKNLADKDDNICPKCHKINPKNGKFCIYCGESLLKKTANPTPEVKKEPVEEIKLTPIEPKKEKSYKGIFIASAVLNVVLIFAVLLINLNSSSVVPADNKNIECPTSVSCPGDKYDTGWYSCLSKISNQQVDSVFFADKYFIKGDSCTLRVYFAGEDTVSWVSTVYGEADDTTYSNWKTDKNGMSYFEIVYRISKDAYGITEFTLQNDSSRSFYVFFSNIK